MEWVEETTCMIKSFENSLNVGKKSKTTTLPGGYEGN